MDTFFKGCSKDDAAESHLLMELYKSTSAKFSPACLGSISVFPVATLSLMIATRIGAGMSERAVLAALVVGVVCLGVPHGSLDPLVARKLWGTDSRFTMPGFLLVYALLAALCAASWFAAPNIALSLFLMISALHFGSDWHQRGSFLTRSAYGACVVTVPTLHHAENVRQIYLALGATNASGMVTISRDLAWIVAIVAVISTLPQIESRWQDLLEITMILIGGFTIKPLVFFICYFCLLHSPRHLFATAKVVGLSSLSATVKVAAPTIFATLGMAAVLWRALPTARLGDRILEIIFVGLAALTVPHMLLTSVEATQTGAIAS